MFFQDYAQGRENKGLLDADVLKAASLSYNLAKAMPAVLNANARVRERRGTFKE